MGRLLGLAEDWPGASVPVWPHQHLGTCGATPTRLVRSTWAGAWGRSGACSGVRAEEGKPLEGAGKGSPFRTPLGTRRAPTTPPEKHMYFC